MLNKKIAKDKKEKNINEIRHRFNVIFIIIVFLSASCIGVSIAFIIKHFLSMN